MTISVAATSVTNHEIVGNATVSISNPALPTLSGTTYASSLSGWDTVKLPG